MKRFLGVVKWKVDEGLGLGLRVAERSVVEGRAE